MTPLFVPSKTIRSIYTQIAYFVVFRRKSGQGGVADEYNQPNPLLTSATNKQGYRITNRGTQLSCTTKMVSQKNKHLPLSIRSIKLLSKSVPTMPTRLPRSMHLQSSDSTGRFDPFSAPVSSTTVVRYATTDKRSTLFQSAPNSSLPRVSLATPCATRQMGHTTRDEAHSHDSCAVHQRHNTALA